MSFSLASALRGILIALTVFFLFLSSWSNVQASTPSNSILFENTASAATATKTQDHRKIKNLIKTGIMALIGVLASNAVFTLIFGRLGGTIVSTGLIGLIVYNVTGSPGMTALAVGINVIWVGFFGIGAFDGSPAVRSHLGSILLELLWNMTLGLIFGGIRRASDRIISGRGGDFGGGGASGRW